jgi:CheY-like chemotaxis protein
VKLDRPGVPTPEPSRDELVGALHEVSNALTVVLGWLDEVRAGLGPGSGRDAVEVAATHARLGHVIARRAIGARCDEGTVSRGALGLARDAALGVSREAARRGVEISVEGSKGADVIVRASDVAMQILVNLLLNAVAFSRSGDVVRLVVEPEGDRVRFVVADSGPGVAPHLAEGLFKAPSSTRPGGAGVGLRHSHALADSLGGALRLASTNDEGSRFELVWPGGDPQSGTLHRPVSSASLEGQRVLVLEDDEGVGALIELGLGVRGAEVVWAVGLGDLETILTRGVFDVALLDLSPLGPEPSKVIQGLREGHPELSIVVISGSAAPDVEPTLVDAWVRKPFEVGELVQAMCELRAAL